MQEDYPSRLLLNHPSNRPTAGQEIGTRIGGNRKGEAFEWYVGQQETLHTFFSHDTGRNANGVEGDVHPALFFDDRIKMTFNSLFLESVNLRCFGPAAGS